jgi:hypothetical protein
VKTRLVVPALGVAVAALLSACQPGETGAAAVVGKNRLTEAKAESDTKATIAAMGTTGAGGIDPGQILDTTIGRFVHHELLVRAARQVGVSVSKADVDALLAPAIASNGLAGLQQQAAQQASVPPKELDAYASDVALENKLGAKLDPKGSSTDQQAAILAYYEKLGKQVGIAVSPRYGTYDLSTLSVVAGPDDLSKPTGSPSASAP